MKGRTNCPFQLDFFFIFEKNREKEPTRTSWGGAEGERKRILSESHAQPGVRHRAQSHNCEIMTWVKIQSQMLDWVSHPGAPFSVIALFSTLNEKNHETKSSVDDGRGETYIVIYRFLFLLTVISLAFFSIVFLDISFQCQQIIPLIDIP